MGDMLCQGHQCWMVGPGGLWSSHGRESVRERSEALAGCPGVMGQQKLRGEALVGEEQA